MTFVSLGKGCFELSLTASIHLCLWKLDIFMVYYCLGLAADGICGRLARDALSWAWLEEHRDWLWPFPGLTDKSSGDWPTQHHVSESLISWWIYDCLFVSSTVKNLLHKTDYRKVSMPGTERLWKLILIFIFKKRAVKYEKTNAVAGDRTRVTRVTGGNTHHYTTTTLLITILQSISTSIEDRSSSISHTIYVCAYVEL